MYFDHIHPTPLSNFSQIHPHSLPPSNFVSTFFFNSSLICVICANGFTGHSLKHGQPIRGYTLSLSQKISTVNTFSVREGACEPFLPVRVWHKKSQVQWAREWRGPVISRRCSGLRLPVTLAVFPPPLLCGPWEGGCRGERFATEHSTDIRLLMVVSFSVSCCPQHKDFSSEVWELL